MNQKTKIKVKIFCITFFAISVLTNYYEHRKNINAQNEKRAIEKFKAEAALAIQSEKNKKILNDKKNQIKSEQEYADIIRKNLEKNCIFWKEQYSQSRREQDKIERDNSCRLIGRYFQ